MRKCLVSNDKGKAPCTAMFHQWTFESRVVEPSLLRGGHQGGQISSTYAIVEYDNGIVDIVHPTRIKFVEGSE